MTMRCLPNCITGMRIAGSIFLAFLSPLSASFWAVYLLCGISDMLDGWLARRLHAQSRIGAALDSTADLLFVLCAGVRLLLLIVAQLDVWAVWIAAGLAAVKLSAYAVGAVRYRRFAALHTMLNKLTGAALFLLPLFLWSGGFQTLCALVEAIALAAAVEELLIQLKTKTYNANIQGVWRMHK